MEKSKHRFAKVYTAQSLFKNWNNDSYHPETSGTGQRMTFSGEKRLDFAIHVKKQCFVGIGWTLTTVCTVSSTINVPNIFTQLISLFEIVQAYIKCFPQWKLVWVFLFWPRAIWPKERTSPCRRDSSFYRREHSLRTAASSGILRRIIILLLLLNPTLT